MLFHSSIRKELARGFGATFVALITIVMTMLLIRTLGLASRGRVNPSDVMLVLGYTILGHLPTILTLSLFIAAVATLSRMYRDSEMVIWFSAGQGLMGLIQPLLRFSWPVLLVVASMALLVWPWSNQQILELRSRFEQRSDIERVTPGQFQESANGSRVFFVDKDSPEDQIGNNVFLSATDPGKESVTSARTARVELRNGDRFVILNKGQRLETTSGKEGVRVSDFEEYGTRIGEGPQNSPTLSPRALTTLALLAAPTPANLGELSWRIGFAIAAFNFLLIALALATGNARSARTGNLVLALFAFVIYYNLINLGQSWIASSRMPFAAYVLLLHGCVFALTMAALWMRHSRFSLWAWMRHGRAGVPA
ncbi:LPS export ABC transporter permease LptF [Pseudorhodoferax sp. Leaf267]|uniref:LPS export ABC transporter permease LptF n=1 Tax=Pseudorhodoferax sp. Leaf267 TaxID=1736316 RepID=UPI0006F75C7C|nr:LPS export ABC transporter permease LptF [Pseudorhodoferax sp. Leaf267]KQP15062.1 LPS export ABC transporter permease LptF [Pseudorhodoferax sp. Leaf267]